MGAPRPAAASVTDGAWDAEGAADGVPAGLRREGAVARSNATIVFLVAAATARTKNILPKPSAEQASWRGTSLGHRL